MADNKHSIAQLGAVLADLVANVYGLVTENEGARFGLLDNRLRMIKAQAGAIIAYAEEVAKSRVIDKE